MCRSQEQSLEGSEEEKNLFTSYFLFSLFAVSFKGAELIQHKQSKTIGDKSIIQLTQDILLYRLLSTKTNINFNSTNTCIHYTAIHRQW